MLRATVRDLAVGVVLAACFAACSSKSGTPNDAGSPDILPDAKGRIDTGNADRGDSSLGTDANDSAADRVDVAADRADSGADTHDSGSGGASGSDAGDSGAGGAADSGMGGAAGSSMGGNGAGGMAGAGMGGAAGTDAGNDAIDAAQGGSSGSDAGSTDTPIDGSPSSDATDSSGPACGVGCPANVQPGSLVLWLSADVGVACDQSMTPPRVTGWQDRRPNSTVTLRPVGQKVGPRCDGQTLSGVALPFFDRTTTDVDTGILSVDLTPLNGSDYTVFVVERRRSIDARYVLGTDVPFPTSTDCLNDNANLAYRFGYRTPVLFGAGSYVSDVNEDCDDPSVSVPTFSTPQAMLEVERLQANVEHTMTIGAMTLGSGEMDPMHDLLQGYLGRAAQLAFGSDSRYMGEVAEVVIYGTALAQPDIAAVTDYLKSRWGL